MIDSCNLLRGNHWSELAIWSNRRLGEMLRMAQEEGTLAAKGQPKKEMGHDAPLLLKDIGIEPDQSKRAQKLADIEEETIEEYVVSVAERHDKGIEVSKAGLIRFATGAERDSALWPCIVGSDILFCVGLLRACLVVRWRLRPIHEE